MAPDLKVTRLEVGALATNCYLLWLDRPEAEAADPGSTAVAGRTAAVIDPGGDGPLITRALERAGRQLEWIVLTHGHADHIAAVPALLKRWPDASVVVSGEDQSMLGDAEANLSTWVGPPFVVSPERCVALAGGESVAGEIGLEVLATPGHTPGGLCFARRSGPVPVLFSGDTLFAGSVGRCDLPGGSWTTLASSLRTLATLPESTLVYPGHGPQTVLRAELRGNPYLAEATTRER